jgi:2-deoxy-D-gluconate 3-dehydrogenase
MADLFSLEGRRALVVGGGGDLGMAMLEALLEAGASAVAADRAPDLPDRVAALQRRGLPAHAVAVDVTDRDAIERSVTGAEAALGGSVDILINSAGIQRRAPSEEFSGRDWDDVLSVNLSAAFFYCQRVGRGMIAAGRGKIINVASLMSTFGGITIPAYAASKGGIAQLTKALSNDWAPKGICVNAIAPGYMDTRLNTALVQDERRSAEVLLRTPVRRWGVPDDLKGVTVFLASRASDFVTGTIIPVDGGYSAR